MGEAGVSMNKHEHNYYFIRYPLASGGSHLSNLISLDATFAPRVLDMSKEEYISYLTDVYNSSGPLAHLTKNHIISDNYWGEYIEKLDYSYSNSVHLGHAASFRWASHNLSTLKNKIFISITVNDKESIELLRNRERKIFKTDTFQNEYYQAELKCFYTEWFKSDNPEVVDDDINLIVELAEFYYDVGNILDRINTKFNLSIPRHTAIDLHSIWLLKN